MEAPEIRLRESPRIEVAGKVRLQLASSTSLIDATVLDLSATGMGLATAVATPKPPAGESCAFDFALDGLRVEGRGVVVWSRRARPDRGDAANIGVHFQRLEGAGEREVASVVQRGLASTRRPSIASRRMFVAPEAEVVAEAIAPAIAPSLVSAAPPPLSAAPAPLLAVDPLPSVQPSLPLEEPTSHSSPVEAPALLLEEPAAPEPQIEPAEPGIHVADAGVVEPASQGYFDEASSTPAAPRGRASRLLWLGSAGVAVLVVAAMGVRSLFDRDDRGAAPSDSAPAVEPVSASPADAVAVSEQPRLADRDRPDSDAAPAAPASAPAAPASAPAAPAPDTTTERAPAANRASRIVAIEPSTFDDGESVVLRADAPFRKQDVIAVLMGVDPPRYLLRLSGIDRPLRPPDIDVGSPLVQRVRTGLHSTPKGPELHVVVDLSTREVEHSIELEGESLRVRLRPRRP